mmetsp:Transcript_18905/g.35273  ORF Transcript_18905/g.35273 Transcript_18905/m.35273 type:complete len:177 (-) Transcript_18905:616-1146(-)
MRPQIFNPDFSWKCDFGNVLVSLSRWILILAFLVTMTLSSIYMIGRLMEAVYQVRVGAALAMCLLCFFMAYNLWAILVPVLALIFRLLCGSRSSKAKRIIYSMNQYLIDMMASRIFGIDVKDTDGGALINIADDGGYEKELCSRIERLESCLEQMMSQNAAKDACEANLHDSCAWK